MGLATSVLLPGAVHLPQARTLPACMLTNGSRFDFLVTPPLPFPSLSSHAPYTCKCKPTHFRLGFNLEGSAATLPHPVLLLLVAKNPQLMGTAAAKVDAL